MDNAKMFYTFCQNSIEAKDVDPSIWLSNYIVERQELNNDQVLWFCFLCSITYQLPTAYLIWNEYPDLELAGIERLSDWWEHAQKKCPFQTDKLKQRKYLPETVASYKELVGESQSSYFNNLLSSEDPLENFNRLWNPLKSIRHFGRFSVWNWAQMLKHVAGYNIEPTKLMLGEKDSVSFTDGLCHAFGHEEFVSYRRDGKKHLHSFSQIEKDTVEEESIRFKEELYNRTGTRIDNFELETLACAFKKIFRNKDSRYVGYYLDRQAEDIINTSKHWDGVSWDLLWEGREESLNSIYNNISVDKRLFNLPTNNKILKTPRDLLKHV